MSKKPKFDPAEFFYTVNPILLIIMFVLFSLYVNNVIIKYRLKELDHALLLISDRENSGHAMNMLARFHLIKSRLDKKEIDSDLNEEVKLHILSGKDIFHSDKLELNVVDNAVLKLVSVVRFLLGKPSQRN